jgi:hypothetical protein
MIDTAIKWLKRIENPIIYLEELANQEGGKLNAGAIELSKNGNWVSSLATEALKEINSSTDDDNKK